MADTSIPEDLKYSEQDEWVRIEDGRIVIGVTDYAQDQLGDIVFLELPEVGTSVTRGESFGTIESVKAVSDLFAPVSGEILEVNGALVDGPELVNSDCYGEGWILVVAGDASAADGLLDASGYAKYLEDRD
ncbi:MAG: glycine cleavage system protein GcvH [Myxococcota bacterium]